MDPALDLHFVEPLLAELLALASDAARGGQRQVLALNGPVGAGKTSLGAELLRRAQAQGSRLAVASIDDFYLPWERRQRALAGNPFGVSRVPPGSHDVDLALELVAEWRQGAQLRLPRFDKTLRGGQGDRAGESLLEADVLLLEGWLLGCRPLGQARLNSLLQTNCPAIKGDGDALAGLLAQERAWLPHWDQALYAYQPLWQACCQLWLLRPLDWSLPRRWRFQAEAKQRKKGGSWLAPRELDRLVRSSICSLPPALYQDVLINQAKGVAVLDGRRRWVGEAQSSLSSPSSDTG
ncbi:MAG: hypothetical protein WD136_05110 [Cyanobium sp.]